MILSTVAVNVYRAELARIIITNRNNANAMVPVKVALPKLNGDRCSFCDRLAGLLTSLLYLRHMIRSVSAGESRE